MSLSNQPALEQVSNTIDYLKGKNICIEEEKSLNQFVNFQKLNKDHLLKEIVDIERKWLQYFKNIMVPDKYSEVLKWSYTCSQYWVKMQPLNKYLV